jgi:hypothetical protein
MSTVSYIFPSGEDEVNHDNEDNTNHDAEDPTTSAKEDDNCDNEDNNNTIMPPKEKPTAAMKTAAKKPKKDGEITNLPAPKLPKISNFSIEAEDPLTVSYYTNSMQDYANVVFHVNRTLEYGEYKV